MIRDIQLKVCGLRRPADAARAAALGADYLGFILYEKSPRHLALADYRALAADLPAGPRRVAVLVEPALDTLRGARAAGFDRFQIHARHDLPLETVRACSAEVGPDALWLAPKLPPGTPFPEGWLTCAHTFLVDTYHASGYGGSGRTGDWSGYARLRANHPAKTWILAGGLAPENISDALAQSGASFVDVNSGVETAPGEKSADKLAAFVAALAASATARQ